jgi:2-keto-4-pentenoate hydratase/2-oxohepta-3-ene-1,7-dioic acid hydratase in catechol pathway
MLSLSIDKKLDYSTPIFFIPLGVITTNIKPIPPSSFAKATADTFAKTNVKKPTPTSPIKKTENKQTTTVAQKTTATKPTTVAAAPSKKIEIVKQEVIKTEPVKQEVVKKVEPVKQEIASSVAKAMVDTSAKTDVKKEVIKPTPIAQALDTDQTIIPMIPEGAHISHNYREVEALRKQAQLQKELVQTWKPPIGVSPDCACEISFFVNSTGKIEHIKMVKGSGVMMFDISARQALFAMKMPQWTYGKPFTINFRQ